jgi:hypothetical protein
VKAARVPHSCGKEQEGELVVTSSLPSAPRATFIAGRLLGYASE